MSAKNETRSNLISLAVERKLRREKDARASVDVALRTAGGNLEVVRRHIDQRLSESRAKIDKLEFIDHAALEESEFLKAQSVAITERIRAKAATAPLEARVIPNPMPKSRAAESKPQGLMDRMRSGWSDLKARLFGGRTDASVPDYKGKVSAYEESWDAERLASRAPARESEMVRIQENAIEKLLERERTAVQRLDVVKNILAKSGIVTRQKREALPESVRARYAKEQTQLESSLKDVRGQLRIAEATRRRTEDVRIRA
ncbi:MAG: hypothetical protein EBT21_01300 [Actinobacteria bacterium]|nr:hypothetical protein [Actinomycetota bacterium]